MTINNEIKFLAFDKKHGKIRDVASICFSSREVELVLDNDNYVSDDSLRSFDEVVLLQCTGLKDNTKWEQLPKEEKVKFWNENNTSDGKNIKYQSLEDVKRFWEGREIYAGDILKYHNGMILVKSKNGMWLGDYIELEKGQVVKKVKQVLGYLNLNEVKKIGNIHSNPELWIRESERYNDGRN